MGLPASRVTSATMAAGEAMPQEFVRRINIVRNRWRAPGHLKLQSQL